MSGGLQHERPGTGIRIRPTETLFAAPTRSYTPNPYRRTNQKLFIYSPRITLPTFIHIGHRSSPGMNGNMGDYAAQYSSYDTSIDPSSLFFNNGQVPQLSPSDPLFQSFSPNTSSLALDLDLSFGTPTPETISTANGGAELDKRKAQNRAAQRAFRERKEKHVKELEQKLNVLRENTSLTAEENKTLREQIARLEMENEVLRQAGITSPELKPEANVPARFEFPKPDIQPRNSRSPSAGPNQSSPDTVSSISSSYLHTHTSSHPVIPPTAMSCPKVWSKIVSHPRFDELSDDQVGFVSQRLSVVATEERGIEELIGETIGGVLDGEAMQA
ncbi:DNA-binding transcription factor yap1 [Saitoella coloradoensis]